MSDVTAKLPVDFNMAQNGVLPIRIPQPGDTIEVYDPDDGTRYTADVGVAIHYHEGWPSVIDVTLRERIT